MARTRVKICGITRREDALAAVAAGADALGLNFYPASPRVIDLERAADLVRDLPAMVTVVGLFVDASAESVRAACESLPLGLLQFHGDEPPEFCASFGLPWMKAIRVAEETDIAAEVARYCGASAVLLDTFKAGVPGGTGERFDWQRIPPGGLDVPLVLAGGLTPANVGEAVGSLRPYAVDVSGGVEAAPGVKDPALMDEFLSAVRAADMTLSEIQV